MNDVSVWKVVGCWMENVFVRVEEVNARDDVVELPMENVFQVLGNVIVNGWH